MSLLPGATVKRGAGRLALIGAATIAVAAATLAAAPAHAQPAADPETAAAATPEIAVRTMSQDLGISRTEAEQRLRTQDTKDALADRLTRQLGSRAAGAYIDADTGRLVVNVTNARAAERVRTTGARSRMVEHSTQRLEEIKSVLGKHAVTGTTLAIDAQSNTVELTVPRSKASARARALLARAKSYGDAVDVTRTPGMPTTQAVYGGEAIYGGGIRCSAAFVTSGGYLLTAGHCTNAASSWSVSEGYLGPTAASSFPGNDYGAIRIDGVSGVGQVLQNGSPYEITHAATPPDGTYVCKTGSTTGTTCGTVLSYPSTVYYPSGTVYNLIETNVCTQSGDSGGALYASGNTAVGIVSGGTTISCSSSSYRSYFENVTEPLNAYGLSVA